MPYSIIPPAIYAAGTIPLPNHEADGWPKSNIGRVSGDGTGLVGVAFYRRALFFLPECQEGKQNSMLREGPSLDGWDMHLDRSGPHTPEVCGLGAQKQGRKEGCGPDRLD